LNLELFKTIYDLRPELMTLEEARHLLNLDLKATKKEVKAAYRRAARRCHPDLAPAGAEETHRARMQQINAAYQFIVQFIEAYRYDLVESAGPEDPQKWWADRFCTGVWGPPPPKEPDGGAD
jgi:DnaJ-class molecular chaperone